MKPASDLCMLASACYTVSLFCTLKTRVLSRLLSRSKVARREVWGSLCMLESLITHTAVVRTLFIGENNGIVHLCRLAALLAVAAILTQRSNLPPGALSVALQRLKACWRPALSIAQWMRPSEWVCLCHAVSVCVFVHILPVITHFVWALNSNHTTCLLHVYPVSAVFWHFTLILLVGEAAI